MDVYITKPDLDTCLTALILGVRECDRIIILDGPAAAETIADPQAVCIESGGSGLAMLNNFDHHDPFTHYPPACRQAYEIAATRERILERMVEYVSLVDEAIPFTAPIPFPSLASLFSGVCLCHQDPTEQFFAGIKLFRTIHEKEIDPFSVMPLTPEWQIYCDAKATNQHKLFNLAETAALELHKTKKGISLGFLAHPGTDPIYGGLGAMFRKGCVIAINYDPAFGQDRIRKFTIAGKGIGVSGLLPRFNSIETGWGGRETIIGSPRAGSVIGEKSLLQIIIETF